MKRKKTTVSTAEDADVLAIGVLPLPRDRRPLVWMLAVAAAVCAFLVFIPTLEN